MNERKAGDEDRPEQDELRKHPEQPSEGSRDSDDREPAPREHAEDPAEG